MNTVTYDTLQQLTAGIQNQADNVFLSKNHVEAVKSESRAIEDSIEVFEKTEFAEQTVLGKSGILTASNAEGREAQFTKHLHSPEILQGQYLELITQRESLRLELLDAQQEAVKAQALWEAIEIQSRNLIALLTFEIASNKIETATKQEITKYKETT